MSGNGSDYRGCQTKTRDGFTCAAWEFDDSASGIVRGANSCRNFDHDATIGCLTVENGSYDYCDPLSESGSEWEPHFDPDTQQMYYWNTRTQEARWTKPEEFTTTTTLKPAAGASDWEMILDPRTGRDYYWNKLAQKAQWTKPAEMSACVCNDFVNPYGYGNCEKNDGTGNLCYVDQASGCADLKLSTTNPGTFYSYVACKDKKTDKKTEVSRPSTVYAQDKINLADWMSLKDLEKLASDEYGRFFVVAGTLRCSSTNMQVPTQKTIVKVEDQRFGRGFCHHMCATPEEDELECWGYSENEAGDCEFYHEPVSTFQGSANDAEFEGQGCYIKGVSCGGHMAINCEHCPTVGSLHPEMECNGQCIYDYEIDSSKDKLVLGACKGREPEAKEDSDLTNCGGHMATSCNACVTRYTYNCEGGERYCHGDCDWEWGDCGTCPVSTTTTTTTTTVSTTIRLGGVGDEQQGVGFNIFDVGNRFSFN